jgi:microsomal dipeptidase-like Zn-dependent dipeptidase
VSAHLKSLLAAALLAFALAFSAARPAEAFLDKTRFLAHLGIAYFCFHHWVLNPYRQGAFAAGAPHRVAALVKGGVALLFAVHEVRVAHDIAHTSNDPLLHKLDTEVIGLTASLAAVGEKMKGGHFDPSDADNLNSETTKVGSDAAANGASIKDVPVALPGT